MVDNALKTLFTNCADAIRETLPDVGKMSPNSFPDKIREVAQAGGGSGGDTSDLVKWVTFRSGDGNDTLLYKMPVLSGDDCKDPITHGDIETPTKESTNTQNFTYSGWALTSGESANTSALKNVTEDRVVYASYTASVRYYTVNFYDETELLKTVQVTYGADASGLHTPYKDGYLFAEWLPSVSNVTEDIDTYAQYEIDDKDTWEGITRNIANDTYKDKYPIGYTKELSVPLASGSTGIVTMELVAYDHDDLADGSGKAKTTWLAKEVQGYSGSACINTNYTTKQTWETCLLRSNLRTKVLPTFPEALQNAIKPVTKKSRVHQTTTTTCTDTIWIPSMKEVGVTTNDSSWGAQANLESPDMYTSVFVADDKPSRVRYYPNEQFGATWVLRSVYAGTSFNDRYLMLVDRSGYVTYDSSASISDTSVGTLIGFCI